MLSAIDISGQKLLIVGQCPVYYRMLSSIHGLLTTRFHYPPLPFDGNQTLLWTLPNASWQSNHRACFPTTMQRIPCHQENSWRSLFGLIMSVTDITNFVPQIIVFYLLREAWLVGICWEKKKNPQFPRQIGEAVVANVKQIESTRWCFWESPLKGNCLASFVLSLVHFLPRL